VGRRNGVHRVCLRQEKKEGAQEARREGGGKADLVHGGRVESDRRSEEWKGGVKEEAGFSVDGWSGR